MTLLGTSPAVTVGTLAARDESRRGTRRHVRSHGHARSAAPARTKHRRIRHRHAR
jgi:hypothetical protein